jgi:chemotaxis protein CheZ
MAAARRFRIEGDWQGDNDAFAAAEDTCSNSDVIAEIKKLREDLRPSQSVTLDLVTAYRREIAEVMQLKIELESVQEAITQTKREIASLRVGRPAQVSINQLSGELDAVVHTTEEAANTILAAAERIETEVSALTMAATVPADIEPHAAAIMDEVGQLYSACHFQDLTGQRLSRVMDTFGFVERQVDRMLQIWGGLSAIDHILANEQEHKREAEMAIGDQALANGPAVLGDDGHVNQFEIDALFD